MGIIKILFGHCVGKYGSGPGTKLPHILYAGIGLLQLDLVLVFPFLYLMRISLFAIYICTF